MIERKLARSPIPSTPLSALVDDPRAWKPPAIRLRNRGGTKAWFNLTPVRAWAARKGGLDDFQALLQFIEGEAVDDVMVRQGLSLVTDFIKASMIACSRHAADEAKAQAKARAALEKRLAARKQAADTNNVRRDSGRSAA